MDNHSHEWGFGISKEPDEKGERGRLGCLARKYWDIFGLWKMVVKETNLAKLSQEIQPKPWFFAWFSAIPHISPSYPHLPSPSKLRFPPSKQYAIQMSAIFDFSSLVTVLLLLICTATYLRALRPHLFDSLQNPGEPNRHTGFSGFLWKLSRIGERTSPYVSVCLVVMALHVVMK